MVTILKNSNCERKKIKISNCDKTKKKKNSNYDQIKKTQIVTKFKLWQNSSCDKTQILTKLKLWQKSSCNISDCSDSSDQKNFFPKSFFVHFFTFFFLFFLPKKISPKNLNLNCDETQKLKLWWNSKTQIVMKLKKLKFWFNSKTQILMIIKTSNCE